MGYLAEGSLYNDFAVGYHGDHAGVTCTLVTPRRSVSSCPDGKFRRKSFEVVTTSDQFNLQSIGDRIEKADEIGLTPETVVFLGQARLALEEFIAQNGSLNPQEAIDWETPSEPVPA